MSFPYPRKLFQSASLNLVPPSCGATGERTTTLHRTSSQPETTRFTPATNYILSLENVLQESDGTQLLMVRTFCEMSSVSHTHRSSHHIGRRPRVIAFGFQCITIVLFGLPRRARASLPAFLHQVGFGDSKRISSCFRSSRESRALILDSSKAFPSPCSHFVIKSNQIGLSYNIVLQNFGILCVMSY